MDEDGWFNFGPSQFWHRALIERAQDGDRRGDRRGCRTCSASRTACTSARWTSSSRATTRRSPSCRNPPPTDVDRAVARADRRRDRGRRLPADRHRRHAQRGLRAAARERGEGSGRPHRDADRRHRRSLPGRHASPARARRWTRARSPSPSRSARSSLYEAIDRNPTAMSARSTTPTCRTGSCSNDRTVVSINNTTQIDLQGQAASESDGHRHISGTGGQLQFVRGAYASQGRQVVHLPVLDLRQARRAREPHRAGADAAATSSPRRAPT